MVNCLWAPKWLFTIAGVVAWRRSETSIKESFTCQSKTILGLIKASAVNSNRRRSRVAYLSWFLSMTRHQEKAVNWFEHHLSDLVLTVFLGRSLTSFLQFCDSCHLWYSFKVFYATIRYATRPRCCLTVSTSPTAFSCRATKTMFSSLSWHVRE